MLPWVSLLSMARDFIAPRTLYGQSCRSSRIRTSMLSRKEIEREREGNYERAILRAEVGNELNSYWEPFFSTCSA